MFADELYNELVHRGAIFTDTDFCQRILQLETISISRPAAHGIAATRGNIGLPIKVRSRAHDLSYNRISERLESAKRLHRYLNFADDGNHARLDTSIARFVGFLRLGYFTIGSNPPRVQWSGSRPSRLLRPIRSRESLVLPPIPVHVYSFKLGSELAHICFSICVATLYL